MKCADVCKNTWNSIWCNFLIKNKKFSWVSNSLKACKWSPPPDSPSAKSPFRTVGALSSALLPAGLHHSMAQNRGVSQALLSPPPLPDLIPGQPPHSTCSDLSSSLPPNSAYAGPLYEIPFLLCQVGKLCRGLASPSVFSSKQPSLTTPLCLSLLP